MINSLRIVLHFPGAHNDARMNIAIALTAARMGATIANHTDVVSLIKHKDENGKEVIKGANLKDMVTGRLLFMSLYDRQCKRPHLILLADLKTCFSDF